MQQDPGTHAPRKHYILLKLKSQSVDSFFCLSVWWSVSCKVVCVWGREKVKTGGLSIHIDIQLRKKQHTVNNGGFFFCGNSSACRIWKQTREKESKTDICISRRVTRCTGSRRNTDRVWLTSFFSAHFPFQGRLLRTVHDQSRMGI